MKSNRNKTEVSGSSPEWPTFVFVKHQKKGQKSCRPHTTCQTVDKVLG